MGGRIKWDSHQQVDLSARIPTGLTGAAGEYYVAAELSRRGWLATVTIKNAPGTDVLAQQLDTKVTAAIQTKTSATGARWRLSAKDETPGSSNEWYVLVRLRSAIERPDFYVLPRNYVSAFLWVSHRRWLSVPGRAGQAHRDNPQRTIIADWIKDAKERWDLLDLGGSRACRELGTDWILEMSKQFGLPGGHPGFS